MPPTDAALTRRVVLLGVAGTVVGAGVLGGPPSHVRGPAARLAGARSHDPVASPAAFHKITTTAPPALKRWKAPIYDLDDYLRFDRTAHFPHRSVALTIDDGPHPVWTPRYLHLLAKHDIKATFNMIGRQVVPNKHLVRALASEGHVIANHTWTHDEHLPRRSRRDIHREIVHTNEAIHQVTGVVPRQFRAPGGVWGPRVYREIEKLGMIPVDWDIDPRDWARPGTGSIERAMLKARPGNIILCHDGGGDRSETYAALRVVLPELKHRGFHFVTLPYGVPAG
jgi:peptidoglycan/xylan/chitin deacetylase (PgdA/CDA1 family)